MKKRLASGLVFAMVFLTGCSYYSSSPSSTAVQSETAAISEAAPETEVEIVDLPAELYQEAVSAYANYLGYDFSVPEKMEFTIAVQVDAGDFSLGIKTKGTDDFVYPMKEFGTETDTVTLEAGDYTIVIEETKYTGNYRVTGVSTQ